VTHSRPCLLTLRGLVLLFLLYAVVVAVVTVPVLQALTQGHRVAAAASR